MRRVKRPTGLQLAAEVAEYLDRVDMSPSEFGRACLGHGAAISIMRRTQHPRYDTVDRVRAFIDGNPLPLPARGSANRLDCPTDAIRRRRWHDQDAGAARLQQVRAGPIGDRLRQLGREVREEALAADDPVTPAAMISRAKRDVPAAWARCRALAQPAQLPPGEVLTRALLRGLEVLEAEGGA